MQKEKLHQELMSEYTRVAYYYYKTGMTQDEIAKKMQMSRQRVNRIIRDCMELGIVQITITGVENGFLELESALENKYGLKEVRIVDNVITEDIHKDLGVVAGKYLQSIIKDGDIIGFTRGRSTSALVDFMPDLPKVKKDNLTVTQLMGSENKDKRNIGVDDIVYRFSNKLMATPTMLFAPVVVQNEELRNSMMQDNFFVEAYHVVKSCTIAVVGIGTAKSQSIHMTQLLGAEEQVDNSWESDVAGEVCTHFFDKDGQPIYPPFRNRIIAIDLEDYKKIPVRIGVAGLPEKADAIKAALKGNYINVLVTDLETANILLKEE